MTTYQIHGFVIVLAHVLCVYPIEDNDDLGCSFGFKFTNGFYEQFAFKTMEDAQRVRKEFVAAIEEAFSKQKDK